MSSICAVISGFDNKDLNKIPSTISASSEISTGGSEGSDEHNSIFYVDHREGMEFPTRRPKKLKALGSVENRGKTIAIRSKSTVNYVQMSKAVTMYSDCSPRQ